MNQAAVVDVIARSLHDHWVTWSKDASLHSNVPVGIVVKWKKLWVPYDELPDAEKLKYQAGAEQAYKVLSAAL